MFTLRTISQLNTLSRLKCTTILDGTSPFQSANFVSCIHAAKFVSLALGIGRVRWAQPSCLVGSARWKVCSALARAGQAGSSPPSTAFQRQHHPPPPPASNRPASSLTEGRPPLHPWDVTWCNIARWFSEVGRPFPFPALEYLWSPLIARMAST